MARSISSGISSTPPPSNPTSSSPSSSSASDKENRRAGGEKRKQARRDAAPSDRVQMAPDSSNKRRRISERGLSDPSSQQTQRRPAREAYDTQFYDPNQDPEERRAVRKGLRDLATNLNDSRAEYMQPNSRGIHETVERANEYFKSVKQTSDATLDSRLLVSAADLTYRRTAQAVLGDASTGIDVDEYVSKCISYMRQGATTDSTPFTSSQHRRRRRETGTQDNSDDEEDALDWDYFGRNACFVNNLRPALSGFLLGPLSVQKRVRQMTQRRARQERIDPSQAARPQDLQAEDLEKQETSNLTALCTSIREVLVRTREGNEKKAVAELERMNQDKMTEDIANEVMNKHGISDDGGVPLFKFCINPRSFGQTVENLFYISFLVREGSVGVSMDSNELPTLHPSEAAAPAEAQRQGLQKLQAVFSLDFKTWEQLIDVFDIRESFIPHREEEPDGQERNRAGTAGWYP